MSALRKAASQGFPQPGREPVARCRPTTTDPGPLEAALLAGCLLTAAELGNGVGTCGPTRLSHSRSGLGSAGAHRKGVKDTLTKGCSSQDTAVGQCS